MKANLKAALLELNAKTAKSLFKVADKHKVKDKVLLGLWIATMIESLCGVPKDIHI